MNHLRIGIIGMSDGNGHPYSWSAIFNGYDCDEMSKCPFTSIPEYLSKEAYPKNFLSDIGHVTHIWTQNKDISLVIAKASKINTVVDQIEDMIPNIDAVLLARDDAENHFEMSKPFLKAGLPIFIDKPLALSVTEAKSMLALQQYEGQLFSCSSLRYSKEVQISDKEKEDIGRIVHVEGSIMKIWNTYSVHLIEPILLQLPHRGKLIKVQKTISKDIHKVVIAWENCTAHLKITGNLASPISFKYFGEKGNVSKTFKNSFDCFKESLYQFTKQIHSKKNSINRTETLEIVEIIEKGR